MGDGADAGRRRRTRAAARAAGRHRPVARVVGAAVQGVVGEDAHGEGRRIGASDDDRAGVLEVGDDRAVLLGDEVLQRDHAVVGRQAGLVDVDLGRHRHAVQRRQGMAARAGGVGGLRGSARLRLEHAHDGVDRGIDRMQALQDRVDGLASRGLAGADEAGEIGRVVLPEFHAVPSFVAVHAGARTSAAHDHERTGTRAPTMSLLRFHAEEDHVAVEVGNVEVAQAVVVVLRRLEHPGAALHQVGMKRIDVVDEDRDGAMAGQARRLRGGDQVQAHLARAQADIVGGIAVLESDVETQLVAEVGEARHDVLHSEDGDAGVHHGTLPDEAAP